MSTEVMLSNTLSSLCARGTSAGLLVTFCSHTPVRPSHTQTNTNPHITPCQFLALSLRILQLSVGTAVAWASQFRICYVRFVCFVALGLICLALWYCYVVCYGSCSVSFHVGWYGSILFFGRVVACSMLLLEVHCRLCMLVVGNVAVIAIDVVVALDAALCCFVMDVDVAIALVAANVVVVVIFVNVVDGCLHTRARARILQHHRPSENTPTRECLGKLHPNENPRGRNTGRIRRRRKED